MATVQEVEVRCGTCGYWMPVAAADPTADAGTVIGASLQCRKCLQRTAAAPENMRVKVAGGGYTHWQSA
jgi:hypothetical protein